MIKKDGEMSYNWMIGNRVGYEEAKAISEMLQVNTTLTSLCLSCEE